MSDEQRNRAGLAAAQRVTELCSEAAKECWTTNDAIRQAYFAGYEDGGKYAIDRALTRVASELEKSEPRNLLRAAEKAPTDLDPEAVAKGAAILRSLKEPRTRHASTYEAPNRFHGTDDDYEGMDDLSRFDEGDTE